jgi:hypothetical protein
VASSVAPAPSQGRAADAKRPHPIGLAILLAAGVGFGVAGLLGEYRSPVNGDVAWLLYLARQSLAGARPYVDFIEINPPLVIWLNRVVVAASDAVRLDPVAGYRLFMLAIVAWSMAASAWLLLRLTDEGRTRTAALLLAQWVTLIAMPAGYFGEREHVALALFYPYLWAVAAGLKGHPLRPWQAVLVGTTAAVGFCLKPHFLVVWIGMFLYSRYQSRPPMSRPAPLDLTILGSLLAYAAAVPVLAPEYFSLVARLGAPYSRFSSHSWFDILTRDTLPLSVLLALGVYAVFRRTLKERMVSDLLALAAAGFMTAVLLQGKGFGYHYLTAVGAAVLLMVSLLVAPAASAGLPRGLTIAFAVVAVAVCLWPFLGATSRRAQGELTALDRWTVTTAAYLRSTAPGQPVGVLSARMADAFPLIVYSGSDWPFRFQNLWFVPVFESGSGHSIETEAWCRRVVAEDLALRKPGVLLVREYRPDAPADLRSDYVAYLSRDTLFAAEFRNYERVDEVGELAVYRRRGTP